MIKRRLLLTARIWITANVLFAAALFVFTILIVRMGLIAFLSALFGGLMGSLPISGALFFVFPWIIRKSDSASMFFSNSLILLLICSAVYGLAAAVISGSLLLAGADFFIRWIQISSAVCGVIATISLLSLYVCSRSMEHYYIFCTASNSSNKHLDMETTNTYENAPTERPSVYSNRILTKGIITAILIGVMMIPTIFIDNLVQERQSRQASVVKEVNSRWAASQTLTGPYIYLPYTIITKNASDKLVETKEHLLILPDSKQISGKIDPEIRLRSIYKVLLYHASLSDQGQFNFQLPKEISSESVEWKDARICFGITDFKGIEEKVVVQFNGTGYELSPGLPDNEINEKGLSASIPFSPADSGKTLSYSMHLKIKGSEMLHFVPLGGNSEFTLGSNWPSPSFDGNNIPSSRQVSDSGFAAKWVFNKANLPFGTVLSHFKFEEDALAFGVTMVQPADQYAKTDRSIKYAILIIGLTFSLFFIVELMQRKPVHPVQYVLIGLGLIIFYSLLLGISEFIPFDYAYLIASVSTILLIGLYARGHFQSWKSAGLFGGILTLLYGFIFVLIRLEDTALLVGSIGLFVILAITMYASKRVNWYGGDKSVGSVGSVF